VGDVDVWTVALRGSQAQVEAHAAVLSADERERASRFAFEVDRQQFVIARGSLRKLLGSYLDLPAASVRFDYGPRGKPRLAEPQHDGALAFNVAHSRDRALIAVGSGSALGVDLEFVRSFPDMSLLARRVYSCGEQRRLERLEDNAYVMAFYRFWTRKEALLKLTGDGLSQPLNRVEVDWDGAVSSSRSIQDESGCVWRVRVHDLVPMEGYLGALAVEGDAVSVVWRSYTPGKM
jgi:4'-phosphopantetheinyl transferase